MKMMKAVIPVLLCIAVLITAGCSKKQPDTAMQPVPRNNGMGAAESLDSEPIGMGIGEGRTTEGMLPVYFGYDSYSLPNDQISRMQVNVDFLRSNGNATIRIEGNCDPRGTREYNMALGERRAITARDYLVSQGISASRLSTISFGKERLLVQGHDELSWAQNRRDDFVVDSGMGGM